MSQTKPPSPEADNHPPQPRSDDVVLGGAAPIPVGGVVLGGLEGVKRRLAAAAAAEQRVAALKEALKYGEAGLELVMLGLEDESQQVQYAASSLLAAQDSPKVKQRLRNYLLWFEFEVVTVDSGGRESSRYQKQVQYFPEDLGNGVFLDMVSIPGGTFLMGSDHFDERPQHMVTLKPFYLGKFLVTQQQWKAVAALPQVRYDLNSDPSYFKGDNLPVEQVSWYEAFEFCQRLSQKTGRIYRLPSEAEWEYACRAGTTTFFHFGETITPDLANYNGNYIYGSESKGIGRQEIYPKETTSVGSFQVANAFGLYDMHGNVWEWCADSWHTHYHGAPLDGRAWDDNSDNRYRLSRGGSWSGNLVSCRSASRGIDVPSGKSSRIGFRVVCTST